MNQKYSIIIVLVFLGFHFLNGQVRINEVVTSNYNFLDEEGDSPDWIELKNFGTELINLKGWYLSDDQNALNKWKIDDLTLDSSGIAILWASGKDRSTLGIAHSIISIGEEFSWIIPNQNTLSSWTQADFNDSDWKVGPTGFGYGDADDNTTIPNGTISVFIRKKFELTNTSQLVSLLLHMDYDDAFVAYLNGHEIARSNIDGLPPSFSDLANTDHEASLYLGEIPDRFEIVDFDKIIVEGENVLAIQGHNIGIGSSDFTLIPFLSAYLSSENESISPPDFLGLEDQMLHTNFKLSNGETVYISDGNGQLIDSIWMDSIPSGSSYGISFGDDNYVYFAEPTPGQENTSLGYSGVLSSSILFSHPGGLTEAISLELSGANEDEIIRYTLDATEPNTESNIYLGPIEINQNTVVRARVFKEGYLEAAIQSRSYILNADHDLPIVSLVTEPDNFFDQEDGIYVLGQFYNGEFPFFDSNIWEDWERPINFSFYESNGDLGISFDAGTKIFGGWSRAFNQRSLSIFARSKYGTKEIKYPLFKGFEYDNFQALVLRNSGNDWLRANLRDGILTGLMASADIEIQGFRPVVTYLNGDYWGIYNLREKVNEHFIASKFDVDIDSIDILELNGNPIHGDNTEYIELLEFLNQTTLQSEENYNYVVNRIEIDNYILYQLSQIYFDNRDWPGNNIKFWKEKGGKWRWILFDLDFGFGIWDPNSYNSNTLAFALSSSGPDWPNPPWSTLLFRKLIQNDVFKHKFINQYADELNSRFLPDKVREHIDTFTAVVNSEITNHFLRWNSNPQSWSGEIVKLKTFAGHRHGMAKQHVLSTFGLSQYHKITIENATPEKGYVKLNSLNLTSEAWSGDYFQDVPIKISAIAYPGYKFSYWTGASFSTSPEIIINPTKADIYIPVFEESESIEFDLVINEINYNSDKDFDTGDWIEIYNPNSGTLDLTSWELRDSKDRNPFKFPEGSIIPGNGFLLICQETSKFQDIYPSLSFVMGDLEFGLSSIQDSVRLFDNEGELVDFVFYTSLEPWPIMANGKGATLELLEPQLKNEKPENWGSVNDFGSPGKENIKYDTPGGNEQISNLKVYPNPFYDEIFVTFDIKQPTTIKASLYGINGAKIGDIFNGPLGTGTYIINKNLYYLSRGVYIFELNVGGVKYELTKWIKI